jgi:Nitrile hydratase beta subunit
LLACPPGEITSDTCHRFTFTCFCLSGAGPSNPVGFSFPLIRHDEGKTQLPAFINAEGTRWGISTNHHLITDLKKEQTQMPSQDLREQLEVIRSIQPAVHVPQNWNYENTGPMYKAYMHPPHDVGGQFDVPIYYEEKEEEEWELNTYVTCEVLGWRGAWTAEERRRRADNDLGYTLYLGMPYYARWIWAAAKMLVDKKHVSLAELQEKIAEVKSRYDKK